MTAQMFWLNEIGLSFFCRRLVDIYDWILIVCETELVGKAVIDERLWFLVQCPYNHSYDPWTAFLLFKHV